MVNFTTWRLEIKNFKQRRKIHLQGAIQVNMSFIHVSPESHFPIQNLPYGVFSTSENVSFVVIDLILSKFS